MIFEYPESRLERVHGPAGYATYKSYRPWLRDECTFRCTYCLKRENWGQVTGEFELDHFQPQSLSPQLRLDYFNLVYACRRCNEVKLGQPVDNPLTLLSAEWVLVGPDGILTSNLPEVKRLIQQLDLNSPRLKKWRVMWMRIVELAMKRDPELHSQLMGFPDDLPNLASLRPPQNSRPDGVENSWFAKRQRGELADTY